MTAIELKAELFRQIDTMADNEPMLLKVLNYIGKLRVGNPSKATIAAIEPYSLTEINNRIDASLNQIEEGKIMKDSEVREKLEEEFEWLR